MKIKTWKSTLHLLVAIILGTIPGQGLFLILNYYMRPQLTHLQLMACAFFCYALVAVGLFLGGILGATLLIFKVLNEDQQTTKF